MQQIILQIEQNENKTLWEYPWFTATCKCVTRRILYIKNTNTISKINIYPSAYTTHLVYTNTRRRGMKIQARIPESYYNIVDKIIDDKVLGEFWSKISWMVVDVRKLKMWIKWKNEITQWNVANETL